MSQNADVPRPFRRSEHRIRFATREAQRGWTDLVATARNAAADAWEFLVASPTDRSDRCYPLKGDLGLVTIDGHEHVRWQYKPTSGGRIWYVVVPTPKGSREPGVVWLERVTTGHPNETIKNHH